jgi:hypothetical protein
VPARSGDDAVNGGQAEAGALAFGLGREERLEGAFEGCLAHTGAVVGDAEPHVAARLCAVSRPGLVFIDHDRVDADVDRAAGRHGVARVDHEVEQDLFDLPGVGSDGPRMFSEIRPDLDVRADCAPEQLLDARQHGVEVYDLRLNDFCTGEREELPGEARGAVAGLNDLQQVTVQCSPVPVCLCGGFDVSDTHGGVPEDDAQQVVEVVCDPARQLAQALQPLGLALSALELFFLGYVLDHRAACFAAVEPQ